MDLQTIENQTKQILTDLLDAHPQPKGTPAVIFGLWLIAHITGSKK